MNGLKPRVFNLHKLRTGLYLLAVFLVVISGVLLPGVGSFAADKKLHFVAPELPPYNYLDRQQEQAKANGFAVELVTTVFQQLGYETEIMIVPHKRALAEVIFERYAGVFSIVQSQAREQYFIYSEPLFYESGVFFKRKADKIDWQDLSDLKHLRIGLSGGYYYGKDIEQGFSHAQLTVERVVANKPELRQLRRLKNNLIDLAGCPLQVCRFLIAANSPEFDDLDYIDRPLSTNPTSLHLAISRKLPNAEDLIAAFNQQLDVLRQNGQLRALKERYGLE